jgi:hypothetical protein
LEPEPGASPVFSKLWKDMSECMPGDVQAIRQFRMISPKEATVRKVVGAAITLLSLRFFFRNGADSLSLWAWHLLFSSGAVVYRMGVESQ